MLADIEIIKRLLIAVILSGLVGLERETHGRAAGLRTHILVCLGSTLITLTSMHIFEIYRGVTSIDPARIAAQVVSGIGFLGAGTIIRSRASIRGLTTAASLWTVAGIGLAVGVGFYQGAYTATLLVLITLFLLNKIEKDYLRREKD
jgi:putative Mg2+ transporter-C (MgtC) family protein